MKLHGFGWWRPGKFDWEVTRFHKDVLERLMVGTELLRNDYKRQWHAFQDIRDVHFRMWQAKGWLTKHPIIANPGSDALARLPPLHQATRTDGNLADGVRTTARRNPPGLFYDDMKELFHNRQTNRTRTYPYIVAGNKMRTKEPLELVDDLFAPRTSDRRGPGHTKTRSRRARVELQALQGRDGLGMMMITESIDAEEAAAWYNDLCRSSWPRTGSCRGPAIHVALRLHHLRTWRSRPLEPKVVLLRDASNSPEDDSHKMGLFGFGQAHAGLREQYRLDRIHTTCQRQHHRIHTLVAPGAAPPQPTDRPSIKAEDLIFGRLMTVPFHRSGSNQNSFNPVFEEAGPSRSTWSVI
ncbi:unnamed protein product, partial [Clonostachys rosea f. rosea IK726]